MGMTAVQVGGNRLKSAMRRLRKLGHRGPAIRKMLRRHEMKEVRMMAYGILVNRRQLGNRR